MRENRPVPRIKKLCWESSITRLWSEEERQSAVQSMVELTDAVEKEAAAELLLEAKGFEDVVVNLSGETVDVIVPATELADDQRAQIEDVIKRKTGVESGKYRHYFPHGRRKIEILLFEIQKKRAAAEEKRLPPDGSDKNFILPADFLQRHQLLIHTGLQRFREDSWLFPGRRWCMPCRGCSWKALCDHFCLADAGLRLWGRRRRIFRSAPAVFQGDGRGSYLHFRLIGIIAGNGRCAGISAGYYFSELFSAKSRISFRSASSGLPAATWGTIECRAINAPEARISKPAAATVWFSSRSASS